MKKTLPPLNKNSISDQPVFPVAISELIKDELVQVSDSIEHLAPDRLPCIKIRVKLDQLKEQITECARKENTPLEQVAEYDEILNLRDYLKAVTLERHIRLIPQTELVTPFITYYDIYRNRIGETEELKNRLKKLYKGAVKALFSHPNFQSRLSDMLADEVQLFLCKKVEVGDLERTRVRLFLENFSQCKSLNEEVENNLELETKLLELQALMFFQEETQLIRNGKVQPCEELVNYMSTWQTYLGGLRGFERTERKCLIEVVEGCVQSYQHYVVNGAPLREERRA